MLDRRSSLAPEVPTAAEAGLPTASITTFVGLFGPAGMPGPVVDRIARELNAILARADIREQSDRTGFHAEGSSPEQFVAFLRQQHEVWRQAIADAGIQPD
jgi:tripartite-type tricarboxylate transporter receptor subunit TctC